MAKLDQLLQQVRAEVGADFVSTDVIGMDGLSIAGGSVDPNFDATQASARAGGCRRHCRRTLCNATCCRSRAARWPTP